MSAALKLEIFRNGELIQEVPCGENEIWVGRDEDCVIRLEDRAISRKHALIRSSGSALEFEKKSKFGSVRIGGRNVDHATLKGGEQVELGEFEIRVCKIETEKTVPVADTATAAIPRPCRNPSGFLRHPCPRPESKTFLSCPIPRSKRRRTRPSCRREWTRRLEWISPKARKRLPPSTDFLRRLPPKPRRMRAIMIFHHRTLTAPRGF